MNDINYTLRLPLLYRLSELFAQGETENALMEKLKEHLEIRGDSVSFAIVLALKHNYFTIADTLNAL